MAISSWKDKILFTPGPLTTSRTVKQAMLRDLGSRDTEFIEAVRDIRRRLLTLGNADEANYTTILQQGSGTFGLESVIASTIPADGKLLVAVNGAYGRRVVTMAEMLSVPVTMLEFAEDVPVDPAAVAKAIAADPAITHVSATHCETTTGIMNPLEAIGQVVRDAGKVFIVDAMSCFGALVTDIPACNVDYLVSSANKCVEGVPGFSFIIARKEALMATRGYSRSLTMDLLAQYEGLEGNGQFRFTPPTCSLLAFYQALLELEAEGGVPAREARYRQNFQTLYDGMVAMGFKPYLAPDVMGHIITTYHYPDDANFDFQQFYNLLNDDGYVIYPGKLTQAECFRLGNIGRITESDCRDLLAAIARAVATMNVKLA